MAIVSLPGFSCGGRAQGGGASMQSSNGGAGGTTAAAAGSTSTTAGQQSGAAGTSPSCTFAPCAEEGQPFWHPWRETIEVSPGCEQCMTVPSCKNTLCIYDDSLGITSPVPMLSCRPGYEMGVTPGACCWDCVRTDEPVPPASCQPDECGTDPLECTLGRIARLLEGACCPTCVADPSFCNEDEDCVVAYRPADCCSCAEGVSRRLLADDPCWTTGEVPGVAAPSCEADYDCSLVDCAACTTPSHAVCTNHHCTSVAGRTLQ